MASDMMDDQATNYN